MSFFKRGDGLERELRAQRPEPRPEFLNGLETRIHGSRHRRPARGLRLGLAAGLSAVMLVALAAFGGLGYAATGVSQAVSAAVHVVAPAHHAAVRAPLSSAKAQYKVQMCFHGRTLSVDSHATGALAVVGATSGACSGGGFTPATVLVRGCLRQNNIQVSRTSLAALLKAKVGVTKGFCKV